MKNIMFDLAVTIVTDKEFDKLTVVELVEAARQRLNQIAAENDLEAFGFSDEYEVPVK